MGRGVDAPRQSRHHDMAGLAQLLRQPARDPLPTRRGDPRPDHGDTGPCHQARVAKGPKQGRRRIDRRQHVWIVGVAQNDQPGTQTLARCYLGFDPFDRRNRVAMSAAAPDQVGQDLEGPLRRAEPLQQLLKGHRTDLVGPRQTQARETLCGWKGHPFFAPIRGSVPFRMRAIFS
jgi:hypothetical protein